MMFKNDVEKLLNIELTLEQQKMFSVYYEYLVEYNKITNLTRIVDEKEVYYKHFYDSLTLAQTTDMNLIESICDMGSGAGFPSLPLKIVFPHLKVTIVDSLNKRIIFLGKLVEKLSLTQVELVHDRVEVYATKNQNKFDLVTARALGHMSLITEMGIPMLKKEGLFIGLKAQNYEEELNQSTNGIKILGGEVKKINKFDLPYGFGYRV
ncbi:MAG: 16S rRNA (guanine(527)-N(7))-methyltransferase RsmG, partial [Acholeplasmataceae bacterium]|nr:16S rRNA (guanine(527)-N(7))-methyltransferase RsmG [Acholeplasmataceae bacterium]